MTPLTDSNQLVDLSEIGKSAKRQMQSSLKTFENFIIFSKELPPFDSNEFKNASTASQFGKYSSYLIDVLGFTQNTALCYVSNLKGRLKKKGIQIMDEEEYRRLRDHIKNRSQEVSTPKGRSSNDEGRRSTLSG